MLVSVAILTLIMLLLMETISNTSSIWTRGVGKVQAFQGARSAFEALTRNLAQATLQNYYGYADSSGNPIPLVNPSFKPSSGSIDRNKMPAKYLRFSELHFLSGPTVDIFGAPMANMEGLGSAKISGHGVFFQAPTGFSDTEPLRPTMLNNCGYYVQFEGDSDDNGKGTGAIPSFATSAIHPSHRYRLMEVMQPAEGNSVYQSTDLVDANGLPVVSYDLGWLKKLDLARRENRHVLADNVVLLAFLPKLAAEDEALVRERLHLPNATDSSFKADGALIAPRYAYDSRSWITSSNGSPPKNYPGQGMTRSQNAALLESVVMNRLPPIMQVLMVAIDERSAVRIIGDNSAPPADFQQKLYGTDGKRFTDASKYQSDLAGLQRDLDGLKINYRVFQTEVRLPNAAFGQ